MRVAAISLLALCPLAATIVDRVAITAGNQVITDSEINQRIRLTAFENGDTPATDISARKTAADRLIDEKLVEHEMEMGHYPRLAADVRAGLLGAYAKTNYKSDLTALDEALKKYGLSRNDLETDLARQSDLLAFLALRFKPAVQVAEADIREYFRSKVHDQPGNAEKGIEEFRTSIESELARQRADSDMEGWLKDQRRRTKIQYLEKDLAP